MDLVKHLKRKFTDETFDEVICKNLSLNQMKQDKAHEIDIYLGYHKELNIAGKLLLWLPHQEKLCECEGYEDLIKFQMLILKKIQYGGSGIIDNHEWYEMMMKDLNTVIRLSLLFHPTMFKPAESFKKYRKYLDSNKTTIDDEESETERQ
jgi:hypothetical protein